MEYVSPSNMSDIVELVDREEKLKGSVKVVIYSFLVLLSVGLLFSGFKDTVAVFSMKLAFGFCVVIFFYRKFMLISLEKFDLVYFVSGSIVLCAYKKGNKLVIHKVENTEVKLTLVEIMAHKMIIKECKDNIYLDGDKVCIREEFISRCSKTVYAGDDVKVYSRDGHYYVYANGWNPEEMSFAKSLMV